MPFGLCDWADVKNPGRAMPHRTVQIRSRRRSAKGSLGGDVYVLSEMLDRATLLREFRAHLANLSLGAIGLEDCENLLNQLRKKGVAAAPYSVRHFLGIQRSLGYGESGNAYWLSGLGKPAGGSSPKTPGIGNISTRNSSTAAWYVLQRRRRVAICLFAHQFSPYCLKRKVNSYVFVAGKPRGFTSVRAFPPSPKNGAGHRTAYPTTWGDPS